MKTPELDASTARQLQKDKLFDCYRYLKNVFSLQKHIRNLVKLGRSRRYAFLFKLELFVTLVPLEKSVGPEEVPTRDIVTKILHSSCVSVMGAAATTTTSLEFDRSISEMVDKFYDQYNPSLESASPHPECTLLHYHMKNAANRPFSYVGASKPACYACALHFEAYNKSNPAVPLSIQGTQGHVYPWKALGDDAEDIFYPSMLEKIHKTLGKVILSDSDLLNRTFSENTAASGGEPDPQRTIHDCTFLSLCFGSSLAHL